mmetsp:Transcript_25285/g.84445  ORF Transcript_25285/g.84445 Transcript_25285/m.84445 type:complete len:1075 (+) Transcript_25285:101-3325(+)|eukprot:CAMPEP_0203903018 /NCGR_PEP_ID=MMETSP0359-20131031/44995_1 /ASSEMBLY_ACC=CAM_ASM_000338 /TAXON_ID=268821 /ORGANISM="Scrippsiella Hangoei, Strain SHTV-5" /LENGTH=1074 /DNA_ID=CAMNT_0050826979 /DNA_START=59 /DNA_END=3283 /DNA_ORIENTATION=+
MAFLLPFSGARCAAEHHRISTPTPEAERAALSPQPPGVGGAHFCATPRGTSEVALLRREVHSLDDKLSRQLHHLETQMRRLVQMVAEPLESKVNALQAKQPLIEWQCSELSSSMQSLRQDLEVLSKRSDETEVGMAEFLRSHQASGDLQAQLQDLQDQIFNESDLRASMLDLQQQLERQLLRFDDAVLGLVESSEHHQPAQEELSLLIQDQILAEVRAKFQDLEAVLCSPAAPALESSQAVSDVAMALGQEICEARLIFLDELAAMKMSMQREVSVELETARKQVTAEVHSMIDAQKNERSSVHEAIELPMVDVVRKLERAGQEVDGSKPWAERTPDRGLRFPVSNGWQMNGFGEASPERTQREEPQDFASVSEVACLREGLASMSSSMTALQAMVVHVLAQVEYTRGDEARGVCDEERSTTDSPRAAPTDSTMASSTAYSGVSVPFAQQSTKIEEEVEQMRQTLLTSVDLSAEQLGHDLDSAAEGCKLEFEGLSSRTDLLERKTKDLGMAMGILRRELTMLEGRESSSSADASREACRAAPLSSPSAGRTTRSWKVVYSKGPTNVRASKDFDSAILGTKGLGSTCHGHQDGDWLVLADEPGFMALVGRVSGERILEPTDLVARAMESAPHLRHSGSATPAVAAVSAMHKAAMSEFLADAKADGGGEEDDEGGDGRVSRGSSSSTSSSNNCTQEGAAPSAGEPSGDGQPAHVEAVRRRGSSIMVVEDFMSNSLSSMPLKRNQQGVVKDIDEEGDLLVEFSGCEPQWIFRENLDKVKSLDPNGDDGSQEVVVGEDASSAAMEAGWTVVVRSELRTDNQDRVLLREGQVGRVKKVDDTGDALIVFEGIRKPQWVFKQGFKKLCFQASTSRECPSLAVAAAVVGARSAARADVPPTPMTLPATGAASSGALHSLPQPEPPSGASSSSAGKDFARPTPARRASLDGHAIVEGLKVAVSHEFKSDSEGKMLLSRGMKGVVQEVDEDGDALVKFDESGTLEWIFTVNFDKLRVPFRVGGRVQVLLDFMSDSEHPALLKQGMCGVVTDIDGEGDALVDFGAGLLIDQWIFTPSFDKLKALL